MPFLLVRTRLETLFVIILLSLMLGCQPTTLVSEADDDPAPVATATLRPLSTSAPTIGATGSAEPTGSAAEVEATDEAESDMQALTLWTIEQISPETEGRPGEFVRNSLQAFQRSNTNIKIDVLIKKPSGKGGVLDFLRTAKAVAPTVLPDIAIMNAADLNHAYTEGLIQSLDGRLDRSIVQDLLPASRKIGSIEDQLVGVPLGLEMEHTVYNGLTFETPPLLWTDILTANTKYLFPAKGVNGLVNDFTLTQYMSAGGQFMDDEGLPTLDEGALRDVLAFYQQAIENETIDTTLLEAGTTEELWPIYVEREAGITQITVRQYLTDRELLSNTSFTSLPTKTGSNGSTLIIHGWVLVLITGSEDLERQAAALRFMEWFMSTANNTTWNEVNRSIPTRDTAYQELAGDDLYWEFLVEQLKTAQPQPRFEGYDEVRRILQQAVQQVISGEATSEEAAAIAIDTLTQ